MRTLLLGGLGPELAGLVRKAFAPLAGEFALREVDSLGDLLVLLETAQGDLLFLDLDAPDGVALAWLARLAELRSALPILAAGQSEKPDITGYELRFPDNFFPFLTYLRKPVSESRLVEAVQSEFRHVARGVIEGLSLASLLQMLHMEGKTCTVRVESGRRQGFFYLRAGQIINARYRRAEGVEAALQLLASDSPKAEIDSQLHDPAHVIHMRIEELLMEAMRLRDERERSGGAQEEEDSADELPASETGKWETRPAPAAPPVRRPRKRRLLIAAAVALPLSALPFLLPRSERITIESIPGGAAIALDHRPVGHAPLSLSLPRPLQGSLEAELPGYVSQTHALAPGEQTVAFRLQPVPPPPAPVVVPAAAPEPVPEPPRAQPRRTPPPKAAPRPAPKTRGDVFDQVRQP